MTAPTATRVLDSYIGGRWTLSGGDGAAGAFPRERFTITFCRANRGRPVAVMPAADAGSRAVRGPLSCPGVALRP